jgi:hypothetical protein
LRQQVIRSLRDLVNQKEAMKKTNALTPEQQSELSRRKLAQREHEHLSCAMEVRAKGPHTGLYCREHTTWIRWISHQQAQAIIDLL